MKNKTVGLAAIVALALSAILGVASASASEFTADQYTATLSGAAVGTHTISLGPGSVQSNCTGAGFSATASGPVEVLTPQSMGDPNCSPAGAQMKMNSCKFIFHPGALGSGQGTFEVGPSGCGPITYKDSFGCAATIGAQSGLSAQYENSGTGSGAQVKITANATNIKFTRTGGTTGNCGGPVGQTATTGTYAGQWSVSGKVTGTGVATGVHVVKSPVGIFVGGALPRFEAEQYPVAISGQQDAASDLVFKELGTSTVKCSTSQFTAAAASATAELEVTAGYSGCIALGLATTVNMNSCRYVLSVANAGPPYVGSAKLACSKVGDAVEIFVGPKPTCTISVAAQTVGNVSYEIAGSGTGRRVIARANGEGIAYTIVSGTPANCGSSGSKGKFGGSFALEGLKP